MTEVSIKGISDKVAVIGMGCTRFAEHWDKSVDDLLVEAAYEAFNFGYNFIIN